MRQFIRHPADIPIEVAVNDPSAAGICRATDLGQGGIAFRSERRLDPGAIVALRIALVRPPFSTTARVVWCRACESGYDLGVEFLDPDDAFRARMVEQVCHIEDYRRTVQRDEGRAMSAEEAAMEWIARHAAQFPDAGPNGLH